MGNKIKILLIDDDADYVDNFGWFLERKGYSVFKATSGREGIKIAQKENPRIVLCDLIMLDINGDEVIRKIKSFNPDTITVMVSAYVDDQTKEKLKKLGAYSYEEKIVKFKPTEEYIRRILEKKHIAQ